MKLFDPEGVAATENNKYKNKFEFPMNSKQNKPKTAYKLTTDHFVCCLHLAVNKLFHAVKG